MTAFSGVMYTKSHGDNRLDHDALTAIVVKMLTKSPHQTAAITIDEGETTILVSSADQRALSGDGRLLLLFSGDLQNRHELQGRQQEKMSDAALLLDGYQRQHDTFFEAVRGAMSLAIWDKKNGSLLLVRDHLGIANMYWARKEIGQDQSLTLFSTLFKPLLLSGQVTRKLNRSALYSYMRYHAVQAPHTFIEQINAVPQASSVMLKHGSHQTKRYWSIDPFTTNSDLTNQAAVTTRVKNALSDAVRLSRSQGSGTGIMVDGTIDSALLVALNAAYSTQSLQTFSFVADGDSSRDRFAYSLGDKYNCIREQVAVDGRMFKSHLNSLAMAPELPGTDAAVPFLFSFLGKTEQPAMMMAYGLKDLVRGQRYFTELTHLAEWKKHPLKSHFLPALSFGYKNISYLQSFASAQQLDFLKHWPMKQDELYLRMRGHFSDSEYHHIMHRKLHTFTDTTNEFHEQVTQAFEDSDALNAYSKLEFQWNLAASPLSYESPIQSPVRFPFLDPDLIKLMMQVPSAYKFSSHGAILKPLIDEVGAASLFDQYGVAQAEPAGLPIGQWLTKFCTSDLRQLAQAPWAKGEGMSQLIFKLYRKPQEYKKVWSLLQFKQWMDYYQVEV